MSKNVIQIRVSGRQGIGKTKAIEIIVQALADAGKTVVHVQGETPLKAVTPCDILIIEKQVRRNI